MQQPSNPARKLGLALLVAVLTVPAVSGILSTSSSSSTPNAADKVSVSGSSLEVLGPSVTGGTDSLTATLLTAPVKTSTPEDLVLQLTLECALWTQVTTIGNDVAESTARVKVWVEVDGVAVPVASDDTDDPGKVVFCDRTHRQQTMNLDDEDAQLTQFLATRTANAFTWVAVDVGSNPSPHIVTVKATLEGSATDMATAQAAIGHRTLVVEPTKLVHGASI